MPAVAFLSHHSLEAGVVLCVLQARTLGSPTPRGTLLKVLQGGQQDWIAGPSPSALRGFTPSSATSLVMTRHVR